MQKNGGDENSKLQAAWFRFYEGLDEQGKQVITRHLKLRGEIEYWMKVKDWLVDQFHGRKFELKKGSWRGQNKPVEQAYAKLWLGRKTFTVQGTAEKACE